MNAALLSAFDPLEWHCTGCGAPEGVRCPERHYAGFIQLTCPDRVRTAQYYGMQAWRETQTARGVFSAPVFQPNGAA